MYDRHCMVTHGKDRGVWLEECYGKEVSKPYPSPLLHLIHAGQAQLKFAKPSQSLLFPSLKTLSRPCQNLQHLHQHHQV